MKKFKILGIIAIIAMATNFIINFEDGYVSFGSIHKFFGSAEGCGAHNLKHVIRGDQSFFIVGKLEVFGGCINCNVSKIFVKSEILAGYVYVCESLNCVKNDRNAAV